MAEQEKSRGVKARTQCPNENCHFEFNKEEGLFCMLCGIMLELECTRCGDNPPYARFCQFCGKDVGKGKSEDVNL